jgi:Subtilase family
MSFAPPPARQLARVCFVAAFAFLSTTARANQSDVATTVESSGNAVTANANQTIAKAAKPITDATGRIRYIVDIIDDEIGKPDKFNDADSKIKYHKDKSDKLIADVAKIRGVEIIATTSLVGISFVAYLDAKQVDQLAKDKRVSLLTQDTYLKPSALWNNINEWTGQVRPWGLQALGVTYASSSNGTATVYVLDSGVGLHSDLTGLSAANQLSALPGINPTGCYAHSTHVAGIIGASANNNAGVVGVLPGVRLVSIAMGDVNSGTCSNPSDPSGGYLISAFTQGLQKIYELVMQSGKVGIVNMSWNGGIYFSATQTIGQKMKSVATPVSFYVGSYKGALVAQSAGNGATNACTVAYDAPSTYDGIMVVGGLDDNGQAVVPLNGQNGFVNAPFAGDAPGSNTGSCVEVWAPSQRIKSTWSNGSYAPLSGTSMAAPHIAGFAARLLESDPSITTSLALESAVRSRFVTIGGSNLSMPQLAPQGEVAIPTIDILEGGNARSSVGAINFSKFLANVDLRFQAVGAAFCNVVVTNNGVAGQGVSTPTSYQFFYSGFPPNLLPFGQNTWAVTCYSADGTSNTATANGRIKQPVTVAWLARTSSTGGNWQTIPSGSTVNWGNGAFDQKSTSTGADYCEVLSYGFTGSQYRDIESPQYVVNNINNLPGFVQSNPALWNSGVYFPTSYTFATFYFGNPVTAAPPFGSFQGYKWKLTCRNSDESKTTVMYGQQ